MDNGSSPANEIRSGKLLGIAVRDASRAPMQELNAANITSEHGVNRDFRGRPGARQVTVLAIEDWLAACREIDRELPWTTRRANLLVEGLKLEHSVGSVIAIGEIRLRIAGETEPCARMEEAAAGLCSALTPGWRGGVICSVVSGGAVAVGDSVRLIASAT